MPQRDLEELLFDVGGNLISTGSANAYAVESSQSVSDYYAGLWLRIKANHTNNGASTLSVNGLPTAPIRKNVTAALTGGELVTDRFFEVVYDDVNDVFQLQSAVADGTIGNVQLADMAEGTIKGRAAGAGTGDPQDLTGTQVANIIPVASEAQQGVVEMATSAEIYSAATGGKAVMAEDLETAAAYVALTDAATVAINWEAGVNFSLTVTANRTLGNPTNGIPGTHRTIMVQGNNTTDRAISFANQYLGEVPSITDCDDGRWYLVFIYCHTATHFVASSKRALG